MLDVPKIAGQLWLDTEEWSMQNPLSLSTANSARRSWQKPDDVSGMLLYVTSIASLQAEAISL